MDELCILLTWKERGTSPRLGGILAENLGRKIKIRGPSHEKHLLTQSVVVPALSAQGILHDSLLKTQLFSSKL